MSLESVMEVLQRRLPSASAESMEALARAYLDGVEEQAVARTTGSGPVPTALGAERGELLAYISRALGRLLTEDEISALLRITKSAARTVRQNMLAVYDDLPVLALKAAFEGAERHGRGSAGIIQDGYLVRFSTAERMDIARSEVERRGYNWEVAESSGSSHVLLIDKSFPVDEVIPEANT